MTVYSYGLVQTRNIIIHYLSTEFHLNDVILMTASGYFRNLLESLIPCCEFNVNHQITGRCVHFEGNHIGGLSITVEDLHDLFANVYQALGGFISSPTPCRFNCQTTGFENFQLGWLMKELTQDSSLTIHTIYGSVDVTQYNRNFIHSCISDAFVGEVDEITRAACHLVHYFEFHQLAKIISNQIVKLSKIIIETKPTKHHLKLLVQLLDLCDNYKWDVSKRIC